MIKISSQQPFGYGYNAITAMDENDDNTMMDFGILRLKSGQVAIDTDQKERAFLLIKGRVLLEWQGSRQEIVRNSFLEENPWVLHVPKGIEVKVTGIGDDSEICVTKTESDVNFTAKLYTPEDCASEDRGKGSMQEASTRIVRTVFDYSNAPYAKLVLGEVVDYPGKWSSYPPHYHPQPEIYFYKFAPENGYGFSQLGEEVVKVKNNDTVKILDNVSHPQVTAPGYAMYYVWVIRHLEDNPYVNPVFEPEHLWVLEKDAKIWPDKSREEGESVKTIRLTMAQALVKFLDNQYVEFDGKETKFVKGVFAIFGHGNVTGLGAALEEDTVDLVLYQGRNEQGMAHAATAYAKQKNRRAIIACTTSIGPGALNMVTAAGTATVNRIPLLLLPGDSFACRQPDPVLQQVENPTDYTITANDAFKPVSRYWDRITRPEQLMTAAINAMRVLTDPAETGAVTLCLPQDVQAEAYDYPEEFFARRVHHMERMLPAAGAVKRAVELITGKKKPLIITGGGTVYAEAQDELQKFIEAFQIPFAETQAGKGLIPWDHSLNLGGMGVTGTQAANEIAREADLVIAVGTRLSDFTTTSKWAFQNPAVEVLAINVNKFDAMKMNAGFIQADAAEGLKALHEALGKVGYRSAYQDEIKTAKEKWDREVDRLYSVELETGLAQTRVLGELNSLIGEEAIVVGASGSLPGDLQRVWRPVQAKTYHMEYGFSCMGYEVSGALGVKMAEPDKEVYVMVGDGSYLMLHSELVTSIQEGCKINVLLFDNNGFQCIHNLQRSQGIPTFGTEFRCRSGDTGQLTGEYLPVDFAANARSYGAETYTVTTIDELKMALQKARQSKVSTLLDIKVTPDSMTHGYDNWWRVGVPEVAGRETVLAAHEKMTLEITKAKKY